MLNIEQLKEDAALHRKAAEIWEEDRKSLLEDRAEKERLKLLDDEHKEALILVAVAGLSVVSGMALKRFIR